MGKKITRSSSPKNQKQYVVIFREGRNTEPTYIEKLKPYKKGFDFKYPLKNQGIDSDCKPWLAKCLRAYSVMSQKDISQTVSIWFVFDDDGRVNKQDVLKLDNTIFDQKEVYVAYSSMCIEYWILLHFCEHKGTPIYTPTSKFDHSEQTIQLINAEISKCNKTRQNKLSSYSKSDEWLEKHFDFFLEENLENPLGFLEPKPRIVEAFVRAKKIHEAKIASGNEFAESVTTFYKLLEYLGVVYYKDVIQDPDDHQIYEVKNGCYTKNGKKIKIQDTNLIKNEPYFNR